MVAPQTGVEIDGTWTLVGEVEPFLDQIVADHPDVVVTDMGHTPIDDYPLRRVVLNRAPVDSPTILFVGGVHGNEPAGQEIVLQTIRDLAYSTDPAIQDLLTKVQFVFLPTSNPTGLLRNRRLALYHRAEGEPWTGPGSLWTDINREYLIGDRIETRVIQQTITDYEPVVVIDWHEYLSASGPTTAQTLLTTNPNVHPGIETLIYDLEASIWAQWGSEGIPYARYSELSPDPQTGWNNGALRHAVTITPETPAHPTVNVQPEERMRMMHSVMTAFTPWVTDNLSTIVSASEASRDAAIQRGTTGTPAYTLNSGIILNPAPSGYEDLSAWPQILDVLNAEGTTAFVPSGQDVGTLLPYILDPQATAPLATATRLLPTPDPDPEPLPDEPVPPGVLSGMRIGMGGRPRPVTQIRYRTGGTTHLVDVAQLPG